METVNPLPYPCPVADSWNITQFMSDHEFVEEVIDSIYCDQTWADLSDAFAHSVRNDDCGFTNLGERFAEIFRAAARNRAQSRINAEWEQCNHDFDF